MVHERAEQVEGTVVETEGWRVNATRGFWEESQPGELVRSTESVGGMFPMDQISTCVDREAWESKKTRSCTEECAIEFRHEDATGIRVKAADDGVLKSGVLRLANSEEGQTGDDETGLHPESYEGLFLARRTFCNKITLLLPRLGSAGDLAPLTITTDEQL